jgi:uncharacterized protein YraI
MQTHGVKVAMVTPQGTAFTDSLKTDVKRKTATKSGNRNRPECLVFVVFIRIYFINRKSNSNITIVKAGFRKDTYLELI